jgi:hypothetical protein
MVARGFDDHDADRMITWFAWKRRLRNAIALVFGAAALALLLTFLFRAELPELNWADEPTRSLTELPPPKQPQVPMLPPEAIAQGEQPPDQPPEDQPPDQPPEDPPPDQPPEEDQPPQEEQDAGADIPDASPPDVESPTPTPPVEQESAMARGHRFMKDGDPWKALLAFEEASSQHPQAIDPHYWMGVCYVQLGKYASAQEHFRRALAIDEQHVPSIYGMADAMRLNAQTKESVEWYRRYLELSPTGKYRPAAIAAIDAFKD